MSSMLVDTYTCDCGRDYGQIDYDVAFLRHRRGMCQVCFVLEATGGTPIERLNKVGAALFRSTSRVRIGVWLASFREDREVTALDYWNEKKENVGGIHGIMRGFAELGMLRRLDKPQYGNQIWYQLIVDHPLWEIFRVLARVVDEEVEDTRNDRIERAVEGLDLLEVELDD